MSFEKEPLVSIIIPVYNVQVYLSRCVESVRRQTHKNIEIWLIDDGSPDACPDMCDEYAIKDSRIHVIHKENGGQGSARNKALDIIHGDYVAFLDSDDTWDEDYVEYLLNLILQHNADIAICNYRHVDENDCCLKELSSRVQEKEYTGEEAMITALYWNEFGVAPWAKLYKRELWRNIRFKEDRIYEDLATTYLVYDSAQRVVFSDQIKMSYRIRSNSDIHQAFNSKRIKTLDTADEILEYCKDRNRKVLRAAFSRELASACFIYFRIPDSELDMYRDTVERCRNVIKKYRFGVAFDRHARPKTRIGALVSYLGFDIERRIFSRFIE